MIVVVVVELDVLGAESVIDDCDELVVDDEEAEVDDESCADWASPEPGVARGLGTATAPFDVPVA